MNLTQNLARLYQTRLQLSDRLKEITEAIDLSDLDLQLDRELQDLQTTAENLRSGVFRLLVLGDLKRGKSTFLNALLGEQILPSDVNPCTALLTILRYGEKPQAIVYFKEDRAPEYLDLQTFKQQYTINPDEAKELERVDVLAFPNVDYAVIEYPLPLLAQGIEIVDSPGLNDTEARNKLSLEYVYSCQAVLFMMRAVQPLTMDERRYLENYLKDRGLAIFFLLNGWDEIRKSLVDLDNQTELEEAEGKIRQVFRTNLAPYSQSEEQDLYQQRVFEISALNALRQRLKDPDVDLSNTGFGKFVSTLEQFLTEDRAATEFKQAQLVAKQTCARLQELVNRRIPLLKSDIASLKAKIASVKPEFEELQAIKERFGTEILAVRDRQIKNLTDSFETYVLKMGDTTEFVKTLPSIAQKQQKVIQETIADCFNDYHHQITLRIDEDITARRAELDILLTEERDEERHLEIKNLQDLADAISNTYSEVKSLVVR